ncbi:HET-domain-containing protein [Ophiobolus disseminans]|uniref:HET-domain-containing protein n=1 Tax=Ophiobolus disseminans TaxID=1469910 RepID=A0A6A7AKZ8_9PLEO|nr:HET-domain-containing protein [Ophiobolus disseminans]
MLCDTCIGVLRDRSNIITDEPGDDGPRVMCAHHRTTQTLQRAAEDGCSICYAFWNQLSEAEITALRLQESLAMKKKVIIVKDPPALEPGELRDKEDLLEWLTITILTRGSDYEGAEHGGDFRAVDFALILAFCGKGIDWGEVSSKKTITRGFYMLVKGPDEPAHGSVSTSSATSSDESWSVATSWINECRKTHKACNAGQIDVPWYPTRLLEIGKDQSDNIIVRLIQSANHRMLSPPYCTLSHCWGKAQIIQLNERTRTSLESGIFVDQMPLTFREAIAITMKLGVRYIWIDSLCIIQDSRLDWLHEAGLMHKVYSYSYCNISASASVDSSEGLFRQRNSRILQSSHTSINVAGIDPALHHTHCNIYDYFFWSNNVAHCTINRRAWVVQERMLAPRVLHFGKDQLLWECKEQDACESYPNSLPPIYATQIYTNFKAMDSSIYMEKFSKRGHNISLDNAAHRLWNMIVRSYSRTLLTVPSDKLIALSGLAKRMSQIMKDEYIAGMWRKEIAASLSWYVVNQEQINGSSSVRPSPYRAPTWSWASVDGVISPSTDSTDPDKLLIKVEDLRIEYATNDTTGLITDGWLDLTGPLKPIHLIQTGTLRNWHIAINDTVVRPQDENMVEWRRIGPILHFDVPMLGDDVFDTDNAEGRLFCMVCGLPSMDGFNSVLLLRLADVANKLFERLGIATSRTGDGQEILLAELDADVKSSLPCLRYESGLHTIRVI